MDIVLITAVHRRFTGMRALSSRQSASIPDVVSRSPHPKIPTPDDAEPGSELQDERPESRLHRALSHPFIVWPALLGLMLLIQGFVVKPVKVPSGSMRPTIECGDRFLVDRMSPHLHGYQRGDIVVFLPPRQPGQSPLTIQQVLDEARNAVPATAMDRFHPLRMTYIKRLMGLPGQTVELRKGSLYVDGKPGDHEAARMGPVAMDWGPVTIPDGFYLMLGDNRSYSADSRFIGLVPEANLLGIARARYWPIKRIGSIDVDTTAKDPIGNCK